MKTGKLNDIETTYIDAKRRELSVNDLAKKLGRGKTIIQKYIDTHPLEQTVAQPEQPEHTQPTRRGELLNPAQTGGTVYDRRYGKKPIGAVMTEGLSEQHDAFGKGAKKSVFDNKSIHKIK